VFSLGNDVQNAIQKTSLTGQSVLVLITMNAMIVVTTGLTNHITQNMKTIPLTNTDKQAIVSDIDYDRVMQYRWMLKHNGHGGYYVARSVRRKRRIETVLLHRFIMIPDDGYDVHHRDGNKLDCSRGNLEPIEHSLHGYKDSYAIGWANYVEREYG